MYGMDMLCYIASLLIGVSLGLIGAGGSILTLPVLVYLFRMPPGIATSYSLFVVGATSLVGAVTNYMKGFVHLRTAFIFAFFSIASTVFTRTILLSAIPDQLFSIGDLVITKDLLIVSAFAILMILASVFMLRPARQAITAGTMPEKKIYAISAYGLLVGLVTGFLGAGGGFLLIPALVFFFRMSIRQAIGTSLLIIALNSLSGFVGDTMMQVIDWQLLLIVTSLAITGLIIGHLISMNIRGEKLRKAFGWFVLVMGIYILLKEFFLH
jgi:uncharacterized membrane protein YfcA